MKVRLTYRLHRWLRVLPPCRRRSRCWALWLSAPPCPLPPSPGADPRPCDGWRTPTNPSLTMHRSIGKPPARSLRPQPRPRLLRHGKGSALPRVQSSAPRRRGAGTVVLGPGTPMAFLRRHLRRLLGCPCTSGLALCRPTVCPCTSALARSLLDATSLGQAHLSTPMASHLFRAAGAGVTVAHPALIASGRCHPRSSVAASTAWLLATSPPDASSHRAAFSASVQGTGRGTAGTAVRPHGLPQTCCGCLRGTVLAVVLVVVRSHAVPVSAMETPSTTAATVATARTKVPSMRPSSLLGKSRAQHLRCQWLWVAIHSLPCMCYTVSRIEPQTRPWGVPRASVVDAGGAGVSC